MFQKHEYLLDLDITRLPVDSSIISLVMKPGRSISGVICCAIDNC
jgi:hypothetical protein